MICFIFCFSFSECLNAFQEENGGQLPERIIMYRDGVGDGQLKYVYDVELAEIQVKYLPNTFSMFMFQDSFISSNSIN